MEEQIIERTAHFYMMGQKQKNYVFSSNYYVLREKHKIIRNHFLLEEFLKINNQEDFSAICNQRSFRRKGFAKISRKFGLSKNTVHIIIERHIYRERIRLNALYGQYCKKPKDV